MRTLSRFTIGLLIIFTELCIAEIGVAHSASCPADRAYAGIKIWHYLESTAGPYYTQTTEYEGTVSIQFFSIGTEFYIENIGNDKISKTVDANLDSPFWNCTYETAHAKVNVQISSILTTCNDGILHMKIIEEAEKANAQYHCVDGKGIEHGPFTQIYPATRLEHDVMLEYADGAMEVMGNYSWTLLFRAKPIPHKDGRVIIPIMPLLLSD